MISLEYELFLNIREQVKEHIPRLQALAKAVSELDVLQCFATISEERHYVKPIFSDERKLVIKGWTSSCCGKSITVTRICSK